MHYVLRDKEGQIVALSAKPFKVGVEERLSSSHPEVTQFLGQGEPNAVTKVFLDKSDTELSRILEDVIDLLIEKNHIIFTELPNQAQQKLLYRKRARAALHQEASVLDETDTL